MVKKSEEVIYFPWGGYFSRRLQEFLNQNGFYTESINTHGDEFFFVYSRTKFKATGHFYDMSKYSNLVDVDPPDTKIGHYHSDWKHFFFDEKDNKILNTIGINVIFSDYYQDENDNSVIAVTFERIEPIRILDECLKSVPYPTAEDLTQEEEKEFKERFAGVNITVTQTQCREPKVYVPIDFDEDNTEPY